MDNRPPTFKRFEYSPTELYDTCLWGNCITLSALSAEPSLSAEFVSQECLSGFEFSCYDCGCITTGEINNKPLSAFDFEFPDEWQFTVSWEVVGGKTSRDPINTAGLPMSALSAVLDEFGLVDPYAALAVARYDARRKNYKVDIVPGSVVNNSAETPWGDEKIFEGLRISTDVFYNQDDVVLLLGTQAGGAVNNDIEYIKFWFNGEVPAQVVDTDFQQRNENYLGVRWLDSKYSPYQNLPARFQANVNKYLQAGAKRYAATVKERQSQGFGHVETPFTRNTGVSAMKDYINESLLLHGWNSVPLNENVRAFTDSIKIKTISDSKEVRIWRRWPLDENVVKFDDGIIVRSRTGEFIRRIGPAWGIDRNTEFVINGDIYLSLDIDESVQDLLEPGGVLSSYGPGWEFDRDDVWNRSVRVPNTVWTEVDLLYSPVYTVLSSISSSNWPVSAVSGSVVEPYIDHLNRLYPDEIPAGEVIESSVMYVVLSSNTEALSSHVRINTLSASAANPWWNPSLLTHVSFVSGGKIGNNAVVSLAYNKISLNDSSDIGNTTLLTYNNTMIEVNNAYNGRMMGLVLDDFDVVPFVVDIDNPEIVLIDGYVGGVTDETRRLRHLGFI